MWFGWRSDLSHSDSCGSGILATTEGAVGVQRFVGGRVKGNDSVQSQRLDAFTEQLHEGDGSLLCYLLKRDRVGGLPVRSPSVRPVLCCGMKSHHYPMNRPVNITAEEQSDFLFAPQHESVKLQDHLLPSQLLHVQVSAATCWTVSPPNSTEPFKSLISNSVSSKTSPILSDV